MRPSKSFAIHHVNGDIDDDAIGNLVLVDIRDPAIHYPVADDPLSALVREAMARARARRDAVAATEEGREDEGWNELRLRAMADFSQARNAYYELIKTRAFSGL